MRRKFKLKLLYSFNHRCVYCDKILFDSDMTIDHIIPKSLNGKNRLENYVPSCINCNSAIKKNSLLGFYMMTDKGRFFYLKHLKQIRIRLTKNAYYIKAND